MMTFLKALALFVSLLLSLSCSFLRKEENPDASGSSEGPSLAEEFYNSEWNSYSEVLGTPDFRLLKRYPSEALLQGRPGLIPRDSEHAYTNQRRYSLENSNGVTLSFRKSMNSTMADEDGTPLDAVYDMPVARWLSDYGITAGPVLFSDALVIATSRPAFVILDPLDLKPRATVEMEHLALGLMELKDASLHVSHGDGSLGIYKLKGNSEIKSQEDPVKALIGPDTEALDRIRNETVRSLSLDEGLVELRVDPYGPNALVESAKPSFFRYDGEALELLRLYVHGESDKPYLILVFDEKGTLLVSNVEYRAEKVLELHAEAEAVYYIAAAFMGAEDVALGRLLIVPKNP